MLYNVLRHGRRNLYFMKRERTKNRLKESLHLSDSSRAPPLRVYGCLWRRNLFTSPLLAVERGGERKRNTRNALKIYRALME